MFSLSLITTRIKYQFMVILLSFAESIQNVIVTWLVYKYTRNSLAITLITFVNYFPIFLTAFTFIFIADSLHPLYQFLINNIVLFISSSIIFIISLLKLKTTKYFLLIFILQTVFSCVKSLNRIISNKIIKMLFHKNEREKTIQLSFSATQIFQSIGNFIGNLFILREIGSYGFLFISLVYLFNLILTKILLKKENKIYEEPNNPKIDNKENTLVRIKQDLLWFKYVFQDKKLFSIVFFSIPSSGVYQYLTTTIPFLALLMNIRKANFSYFLLSFLCTCSSSLSGILLFKNILSKQFIQKNTFIICSFLFLLLSFSSNFFIILFLNALCFAVLSSHIILMQIKTNQSSNYLNLGKFTIVRNSVLSFGKIFFSFVSAILLDKYSLFYVYLFPSVVFLIYHIIYLLYYYYYYYLLL